MSDPTDQGTYRQSETTVGNTQHQQQQQQQQHSASTQSESAPFHAQLEYLSHPQSPQHSFQQGLNQYGQVPFDMGSMAAALPSGVQGSMSGRSPYATDAAQAFSQGYHPQQQQGYSLGRQQSYPGQAQQHQPPPQYAQPAYGSSHVGMNLNRQPSFPLQTQMQYSPVDPYGYGYGQFSPVDPRYSSQSPFVLGNNVPPELSSFARRPSTDNSPIPNFPRGPPRKPKQSGHALWVGNLPPGARITDLKDHFSRDATDDIESVFLIAKSSCAFVNYSTEAACAAAMQRFHDSRFHNVRLVCRLRRGSTATPTTPVVDVPEITSAEAGLQLNKESLSEAGQSPVIARSPLEPESSTAVESTETEASVKSQDRFFIVKSLTAQDLEASVRNGIWATQSHNEETLNKAYETAENVYLIFSANKSGEYFGYARMASLISGDPINISAPVPEEQHGGQDALPSSSQSSLVGSPQSIPTPATATAPRGRIIDDSARGTIFWEAERAIEVVEESNLASQDTTQNTWGRQFQIEWKSTNRLPFYRTRGLRNPWNANREVKIARDGTELEPSVGRRLLSMFNRPGNAGTGQVAPGPGTLTGTLAQ